MHKHFFTSTQYILNYFFDITHVSEIIIIRVNYDTQPVGPHIAYSATPYETTHTSYICRDNKVNNAG